MTMSNLSTTCKQKIKEKIAKKIGREPCQTDSVFHNINSSPTNCIIIFPSLTSL